MPELNEDELCVALAACRIARAVMRSHAKEFLEEGNMAGVERASTFAARVDRLYEQFYEILPERYQTGLARLELTLEDFDKEDARGR